MDRIEGLREYIKMPEYREALGFRRAQESCISRLHRENIILIIGLCIR